MLAWFGTDWDGPQSCEAIEIPVPIGMLCAECAQPIEPGAQGVAPLSLHRNRRVPFHRDCWRTLLLRRSLI